MAVEQNVNNGAATSNTSRSPPQRALSVRLFLDYSFRYRCLRPSNMTILNAMEASQCALTLVYCLVGIRLWQSARHTADAVPPAKVPDSVRSVRSRLSACAEKLDYKQLYKIACIYGILVAVSIIPTTDARTVETVKSFSGLVARNSTGGATASQEVVEIIANTMDKAYRLIICLLAPLFVAGGIIWPAYILIQAKSPSEAHVKRDFYWLMAFTSSVAWWAIARVSDDSSFGKPLSISAWFFFIAVYGASTQRTLRGPNRYIFTCLLGGLTTTVLLAVICMHAVGDGKHGGSLLESFVRQVVLIGPFVLTGCCIIIHSFWRQLSAVRVSSTEGSMEEGEVGVQGRPHDRSE